MFPGGAIGPSQELVGFFIARHSAFRFIPGEAALQLQREIRQHAHGGGRAALGDIRPGPASGGGALPLVREWATAGKAKREAMKSAPAEVES